MLAAWIFGFTIGVVLGRVPELGALGRFAWPDGSALCIVALGLLTMRSVNGASLVAWLVAGIVWAFSHSAPPPTRPVHGGEVVAYMSRFAERGPLIIQTASGAFAVEGTQTVGRVAYTWPSASRSSWFGVAPAQAVVRGRALMPGAVRHVRAAIHARLSLLPREERGLLAALLLGDKQGLAPPTRQAFLVTGLLHLLVVSGLHVSLVALALTLVIAWPAQLLYARRWLSPNAWRHTQAGLRVVGALGALSYAALVGMNAASHRSALAFALMQLSSVFCGHASLSTRLNVVLAVQMLVYPVGLFADAAAMSWFAYVVVIEASRPAVGWWSRLRQVFWMQTRLVVGSGALFGTLPLLGLVANPLLVPLFPLILACGLGATLGVAVPFQLGAIRTYVEWVGLFARLNEVVPVCPAVSGIGLVACRTLAVVVWLNTCRRLSIRRYEDS
jgi:ComEC/Rec2-related protein